MVSLHRDLDSVKTRTWKPARRIGTRQLRREKDVLMFNPNLVIMPGLDGLAGLCEDFVRAICGFGGSAREISFPENRCLQFDQLAELVSRDLEANERRPYIIVAQSFSGHVALRLAASKCSRRGVATNLKGVVFVNSFIKSPLPQLLSRTLADSPLTGPRAASSLPPKNVSQRLLVNGDPSSSGIVDKLYSNVRRHPPEVISHRLRMCLETDSSSIFTSTSLRNPLEPNFHLESWYRTSI
ncbi:hypothetical protein NDN08_003880 [Rhodosorus marinus]|uniref:Serine aminopeptidase S33 domain-containing protein n=1 Tax=Rhodosorus marinus TaxID=101924 RepID=A0AAV8UI50_9RHOD|nr:hypothetical protein NDN08_003880 [Rhodosorus marinus]